MIKTININQYKITIYNDSFQDDIPVVLLNTVHDEGENIWNCCKEFNCPDFILVTVSNINWNDDMTPWEYKDSRISCHGQANEYIDFIKQELIPELSLNIENKMNSYILAGYSLAGLFALYAIYQTNLFDSLAIASGSFWYPDFVEYVKNHDMKKRPQYIYFSLGHKEKNTKHPYMKYVEQNTLELVNYYQNLGIPTVYEENQGNHFYQADERMAKAIYTVLNQK